MPKSTLVLALIILVAEIGTINASTSEFLSFDGSEVPDVSGANLPSTIEDSDDPIVLMLTNQQCGKPCIDTRERLDKMSESLQGMVKFAVADIAGTVNVDDDDIPMSTFFNVTALPHFSIYAAGQKTIKDAMQMNPNYTMALIHQAKDSQLSDFFLQFVENNSKMVKNGNHKEWAKENEDTKGKLLLFSKQKKIPPILKRLSMDFKSTVDIGMVQDDQAEVVEKYKVKDFPAILLRVPGKKWVKYDGPLKYSMIRKWVEDKDIRVPIVELTGRESVMDNCSGKGGICLIGLFSSSTRDSDKAVLQKVAARSWKGGMFNWMWVRIDGRDDLVDAFDAVAFPTLLAINPRKGRYSLHTGAFSPKDVRKFVVGVMDGSAPLKKVEKNQASLEDLVAKVNKEDL